LSSDLAPRDWRHSSSAGLTSVSATLPAHELADPAAPSNPEKVKLADGRLLAYSSYGDAGGQPVFYFAGLPGSRLYGRQLEPAARKLGFRVLTIDLPGIGHSDFKANRAFVDTASDVSELADRLELDRFDVVGAAGGAAHALACAWGDRGRINRVALVNSALPVNTRAREDPPGGAQRILFWAARTPWANQLVMGIVARRARRSPTFILKHLERMSSAADRAILARPEVRKLFTTAAVDAFQRGAQGPAQEIALLSGYWDIKFREVTVPVDVWQAEADPVFSANALKWLTDQIPDCKVTLVPDGGQLWLIDNADKVLQGLAARREE
jgi:pimeloyl-ACP methyl ester carboxylesterase